MFKNFKKKIKEIPKETLKDGIKKHYPEIMQGVAIVMLLYLCVKAGGHPVNVNVNVSGGVPVV